MYALDLDRGIVVRPVLGVTIKAPETCPTIPPSSNSVRRTFHLDSGNVPTSALRPRSETAHSRSLFTDYISLFLTQYFITNVTPREAFYYEERAECSVTVLHSHAYLAVTSRLTRYIINIVNINETVTTQVLALNVTVKNCVNHREFIT